MKAEPIYIFCESETILIAGSPVDIHQIESLTLNPDGTIKAVVTKFVENTSIADCTCGHFKFSHVTIPAVYGKCNARECQCDHFVEAP